MSRPDNEPHRRESEGEIPTVRLPAIEAHVQIIQRLQAFVLKHPVAANALFCTLVAEGQAFARTPEGRLWKDRLSRSELIHRARLTLDFPGFSMLEHGEGQIVPSAYLDAVFVLASASRPTEVLNSLFEWGAGEHGG
jgi:hypothetical protein